MRIDLEATESAILSGLKDFQRATVERVYERFQSGQNRVLVADEVGLGKTLVAKGVIAKTARRNREEGDNIFKVVYVCSNQGIAAQNLQKLVITKDIRDVTLDGLGDTRLSMQHLKIFQQETDPEVLDRYIQLIPLTPSTSFSLTGGAGSVLERALIFTVLRRMVPFDRYLAELKVMLTDYATKSFDYYEQIYDRAVQECDEKSNGAYLGYVTENLEKHFAQTSMRERLLEQCTLVRKNGMNRVGSAMGVLGELRTCFARISVERLQPDLVIMDEFQRFRFLIDEEQSGSEMGLLAKRFLSGGNTKVLLLSATPYKLYSTLEEIEETRADEHYAEFMQVMDFLLAEPGKKKEFQTVWSDYAVLLRELNAENLSVLEVKRNAENLMYEGVCRTERHAAIIAGGFIDDGSIRSPLAVDAWDIRSYLEAEHVLRDAGVECSLPVDYVKSAPFLFSYLDHYKLKERLQSTVRLHPEKLSVLSGAERKRLLWVRRADIENYRELPATNARLCKLMDTALDGGNELMMWVPPSLPYYGLQGAYKGKKQFSKVLVFSSWEMVPRMIATQLSYEAERKTVGKLIAKTGEKTNACSYFAKARFPYPRLRFRVDEGAETMSLFSLIYPSQTLADAYDSIDCLNRKLSLAQIEREVREALQSKIDGLDVSGQPGGRADTRWYYLAPMLLDGADKALEWAKMLLDADDELDEDEGGQESGAFLQHLKTLCCELETAEPLGRQPGDLLDVLAAMVVGSPAVCTLRANGGLTQEATQFARAMLNKFNAQEATAAVELVYGKRSDDAHWKNVLRYFCDGCFQAVLDEYAHMLTESHNLKAAQDPYPQLNALLLDGAGLRTVSHPVDTFEAFRSRVMRSQGKEKTMRIRSHYAVGFYAGEKTGEGIARKENVRNAFNSPFRPFVLATTSIGQEGLDFHFYCRKIMHWNLPSNPIDLEQREGRINRFKCLAIRQNLAERYGTMTFGEDVWDELFAAAKESANGSASSELVPFWCLNDKQEVKIERIVPMYPLSRDMGSYERLIKILSLYRLTLGQPRQEEFLEHVMQRDLPDEVLKELFINLSPHYRVDRSTTEA